MKFRESLFMIIFGNVLSKTERNFFIGVRTPWTLASDRCWSATHRFAARAMLGAGIFLLGASFVFPRFELAIAVVLISALAPVGYSYWSYKHLEDELGI